MTPRDFCNWLHGHFELNGHAAISRQQAGVIATKLADVMAREDNPRIYRALGQDGFDPIEAFKSLEPKTGRFDHPLSAYTTMTEPNKLAASEAGQEPTHEPVERP